MGRAEADGWRRYQGQGEQRFRALAAARGLDWNTLDDSARQDLANDLLHDDDCDGDKRHLLPLGEFRGIPIASPAELLLAVEADAP
jgi:hypothetical protein